MHWSNICIKWCLIYVLHKSQAGSNLFHVFAILFESPARGLIWISLHWSHVTSCRMKALTASACSEFSETYRHCEFVTVSSSKIIVNPVTKHREANQTKESNIQYPSNPKVNLILYHLYHWKKLIGNDSPKKDIQQSTAFLCYCYSKWNYPFRFVVNKFIAFIVFISYHLS